MKTLVSTLVMFVVGAAVVSAGQPLESQADCAKQMCRNMRSCNQEIDGVRKPSTSALWTGGQKTAKKSDDAQGQASASCYADAYDFYTGCYGNVVKKPTNNVGAQNVKTATPAPSNK